MEACEEKGHEAATLREFHVLIHLTFHGGTEQSVHLCQQNGSALDVLKEEAKVNPVCFSVNDSLAAILFGTGVQRRPYGRGME